MNRFDRFLLLCILSHFQIEDNLLQIFQYDKGDKPRNPSASATKVLYPLIIREGGEQEDRLAKSCGDI